MGIINLLLLSYLLGLLVNLLTGRRRSNVLCCGIFGVSCPEGKKPNIKNLVILGLYNRTRGTDSCGYYYNGNIVKGIDKESDFKDFIIKNKLKPGELPYETVMCHTRKATYGSHTEENAHPHAVGNLVQTHNGTIKNIWSLCTKHGIPHVNIHVDSIGLAHIIQKDGFGVLNEYEGYAALTMVFVDDPASLYLYHGASKETEEGKLYEERPLFYMQTSEGLYYSSIPESLAVINTNIKNEIKVLPHNMVYKIQHGRIVEEVYKVERSENNVTKVWNNNANTYNNNTGNWRKAYERVAISGPAKQKDLPFNTADVMKLVDNNVRSAVLKETAPPEKLDKYQSTQVYHRYGRFHRGGYVEATKHSWVAGELLLNGEYIIDRDGKILHNPIDSDRTSDTYYFVRGVMMKGKKEYEQCLKDYKTWGDLRYNIPFYLSQWSRYPITSYFDEGAMIKRELRNAWYLNTKKFEGEITLKFTKRKYKIKGGYLDSITHEASSDSNGAFKLIDIDPNKKVHLDNATSELAAEFETKDISEFHNICVIIHSWADRVITLADVDNIPESFYLFLEKYLNEANPLFDERELFNEVVLVVQDLIKTKTTLLEWLKDNHEEPNYLCTETLEDLFKDETPTDIINMICRFKVADFSIIEKFSFTPEENELSNSVINATGDVCELPDPKPEENTSPTPTPEKTTVENQLKIVHLSADSSTQEKRKEMEEEIRLKKKLAWFAGKLEAVADSLQRIDTNNAQDLAFCIYKFVGKYNDVVKVM